MQTPDHTPSSRYALAAVALFILGCGVAALIVSHHNTAPVVITSPSASPTVTPLTSTASSTVEAAPEPTAPARLYVNVAGAVHRPWLYALPPGSRVVQALTAAGGPTEQADIDGINLAEPVKDGEKVYVPTKAAMQAGRIAAATPGNVIGHQGIIPTDAQTLPTVLEPVATAAAGAPATTGGTHHGGSRGDKLTSPAEGQISLNTADASQLERLPGIGPSMAARIVAFRAQAHGFQSLQELQEVGGIGPKKFARVVPFLTLN